MLDGEELAYSLIKAYWPQVADMVEQVKTRRIPASTLVSLAIRAALTRPTDDKLASGLSIPRLRAIANQAREGDREIREKIESFLGCGKQGKAVPRLALACERVDNWLIYCPYSNPHGLPPVLVSAIARKSADAYALFLCLADRLERISEAEELEWKRWMPGIATLLHWFTKPGRSHEIANCLLTAAKNESSPKALLRCMSGLCDQLIHPLPPEQVKHFLALPKDASLQNWRWWPGVPEQGLDEIGRQRETELLPFFERIAWQRELLLYAQRAYLAKQFPDYDPSRRDLWADHNRPWDFDHLHASVYFYNAKSGDFAQVSREWGNCIGNLRAWPFEDNRSDSKVPLNQKISDDEKMEWSLIKKHEILAFSQGDRARHDVEAARLFCEAVRERFLRVYTDWYSSSGIASMVSL